MDFRFTTIAHADHDVMSPLTPGRVDSLLDGLALHRGARVVDVGCGNGAMLVRLLERGPGVVATALGVDRNPAMIARAEVRGARLHPEARRTLRWHCGDGRAAVEEEARAHGPFHALLCVGATGVFGGYAGTLAALAPLLAPGARALIGEGYWRREPAPEYLAVLGADRDEMGTLSECLARARAAGFEVADSLESTPAEWDGYEAPYAAAIERWCAENPSDPECEAFRQRIARWRDAYRRWGRDTLGFASLVLVRR